MSLFLPPWLIPFIQFILKQTKVLMKKVFYMCMILLCSSAVYAQTRTISGVVRNSSGTPIPDATVVAKNSTNGTVTNAEGAFTLVVDSSVKLITISSIGSATQDVAIGNASTITVAMVS